MNSLDELMKKYGSDKASGELLHGYADIYENYFSPLRNEELILLELGVGNEGEDGGGASLKAWRDFFPKGMIYGIDIYDKSFLNQEKRIEVFNISQDNEKMLKSLIRYTGKPSIIIDDASHINTLTIKSFEILFPLLRNGGYYIIEDLECNYRHDLGGSHNLNSMKDSTIMNYLFKILHHIQPVRLGIADYIQPEFYKEIEFIHFYKGIVFIKKK